MKNIYTTPKPRLFYVDNIRVFVVICVVMHHLAVTYSGDGLFYYVEPPQMYGILQTIWFSFYLSFQQAYFMGLLFLLAGFFVAEAYDRKGFRSFISDRFNRLITPTLIYMVIISPFVKYILLGQKISEFNLLDFMFSYGVMWFAVALFIFSFIYACARKFHHKDIPAVQSGNRDLTFSKLCVLILIITICAFLIRIIQPRGSAVLGMQLCHFASYIILFIVGIFSYRFDFFSQINYQTGKHWLISGVVLSFLVWLAFVVVLTRTGNQSAIKGGLNVYSAIYALWESFTAVAVCVGLIGVFKEKFNKRNVLLKAMSDSSFTVYMFHPPIIVGVALLFQNVMLFPVVKWLILCPISIVLCFTIAHFVLRKIPLLGKIL